MLNQVLSGSAASLINHLLRAASWATQRLQAHAGKCVEVRGPLGAWRFRVAGDGLLEADSGMEPADVKVVLTGTQWLRLTAGDKSVLKDAQLEGDAEFATALSFVAEHLRWDYEEDMSRVVGDVAAHRIAGGLRSATAWSKDVAARTADSVKEYLTEEQPMVAKRSAIEQFSRDVDQLRDDVERLAKRIDKLS